MWKAIYICQNENIDNPERMANAFNNYLSTIGEKTQAKIKHSHKKYADYLSNENPDTFFLSPTNKEEIKFVLSSLDINKSTGPYSIPSKVLNILKNDISEQLADLFNLSFTTDTFPTIKEALDQGKYGCRIFVDLQKAFDTVDHNILLHKLKHYGIRGVAYSWFESYLKDRKQYVSINGYSSKHLSISPCVPQGSVLGPLLFLIYINDLRTAIKHCKVHHFSDDTNLLHIIDSIKKLNKTVNSDFRNLTNWLNANKISLNVSKTELILLRPKRKKKKKNLDNHISKIYRY